MDTKGIIDFVNNWRAQTGIAGTAPLTDAQIVQFATDFQSQVAQVAYPKPVIYDRQVMAEIGASRSSPIAAGRDGAANEAFAGAKYRGSAGHCCRPSTRRESITEFGIGWMCVEQPCRMFG